jgi:hypothetical protein
MGEKSNADKLLVRKAKGKRLLGRLKCRWVGNIKMGPVKVGLGELDWIGLA